MPTVASLLLQRFKGRENIYAAYRGAAPGPVQEAPTEATLEAHLSGKEVAGFYLMREDSTVTCAAVDFDNHNEENPAAIGDAQKFCDACDDFGIPVLLELSQSGKGAHCWVFFETPVSAQDARRLLSGAIRYADLPSGTEVYPRQDVLTNTKPLGNFVRYPLSGLSRFVDATTLEALEPEAALVSVSVCSKKVLEKSLLHFKMYEEAPPLETYDGYSTDGLPPRVHQLLENGKGYSTLLIKRWHKDTEGLRDGSMSSVAASLAVQLVGAHIPTPEIVAAIKYWSEVHGYEKGLREGWAELTVARAYNSVCHLRDRRESSGHTLESIIRETLNHYLRNEERVLLTGIKKFDDAVGGLAPQELTVIAARPSHGKSLMAQEWLDNASAAGIPGLLVSVEMSAREMGKRALTRLHPFQKDWKDPAGSAMAGRAVDEHYRERAPVYFVESDRHIDKVENTIDTFVSQHEVGIVVVDYQGLISWKGKEYEDQTEITKRLKMSARRNDVALVSLVQLKRPEGPNTWEPTLQMLRSSGEIEQSADVVVGLKWPYMERCTGEGAGKNDYYLYPMKCRNRGLKATRLHINFDPDKQSFSCLDGKLTL